MKHLIREAKRMQQLAGILKEDLLIESTLEDIPEDELGSIMDKPREWVGKKLKVLSGTYKGTIATFMYYNNMSELVSVKLHDGKEMGLHRDELKVLEDGEEADVETSEEEEAPEEKAPQGKAPASKKPGILGKIKGFFKEEDMTNGNSFQELKKAVDSLASEYTGEDVSITEDDKNQEMYIEAFEKPVFTALLKKVRDELKNNSNYKIDVDSIDKENLTFEIIRK